MKRTVGAVAALAMIVVIVLCVIGGFAKSSKAGLEYATELTGRSWSADSIGRRTLAAYGKGDSASAVFQNRYCTAMPLLVYANTTNADSYSVIIRASDDAVHWIYIDSLKTASTSATKGQNVLVYRRLLQYKSYVATADTSLKVFKYPFAYLYWRLTIRNLEGPHHGASGSIFNGAHAINEFRAIIPCID